MLMPSLEPTVLLGSPQCAISSSRGDSLGLVRDTRAASTPLTTGTMATLGQDMRAKGAVSNG